MRFFKHALAMMSLSLGLVAASASASPANPVLDTDYTQLPQKLVADTAGKKIQVTEFFWYSCPHCNALEPTLEAWLAKQGDKIIFKRVPVQFDPRFIPQQKLYYTLEAMNLVPTMHAKVFNAIHVEHLPLDTDDNIIGWAAKQGIDRAKFTAMYNSFAVNTEVKKALQMEEAYKIDSVPYFAIDGLYKTSPLDASKSLPADVADPVLFAATMQTIDSLIAKAEALENAKVAKTPAKK